MQCILMSLEHAVHAYYMLLEHAWCVLHVTAAHNWLCVCSIQNTVSLCLHWNV